MAEVIYITADTHIRDRLDVNTNFGAEPHLRIGREPLFQRGRGLLYFDIGGPGNAWVGRTVASGTLSLYVWSAAASAEAARVCRTTTLWVEMSATWLVADAGPPIVAWGKSGGDYTSEGEADWTLPIVTGWVDIDIKALCQDALDNRTGQLRVIVLGDAVATVSWFLAHSGEYGGGESYYPKVTLDLAPEAVGPPYSVQAAEVFAPGATAGEVYAPGAAVGGVFAPGAVAGEVYTPGAVAGEVYGAGAVAAEADS